MALLIRNGMILTPEGPDIRTERGTIVVKNDRIERVSYGSQAAKERPGPSDTTIEAEGYVVIPGLIDTHSHSYGTLIPGLMDHSQAEMRSPFLAEIIRGWGEREIGVATLLDALRMMRNGTTTVMDMALAGTRATEPAIQAWLKSGLRAMVGRMISDRPLHEFMPGYLERLPEPHRSEMLASPYFEAPVTKAKEIMQSMLETVDSWHGTEGRIYICLSPSAPQRCTDSLLSFVAEAAVNRDLPVHTHISETRMQSGTGLRFYGKTMIEHISELGLLRPGFSGAHSVWLTDRDIDLIAKAGAGVSHTPLSNLCFGAGIARVPELLRHGVAVGLGTDGPNCASSTALFEIMKLATVLHRLNEMEGRKWISTRDAFRMATIGGARALGLDREIGSIEPGKKADLVLLNAKAPHFIPLHDPVMQLVHGETGSSVEKVLVNGEVVFENGRPTRFDPEALLAEALEISAGLREECTAAVARAAIMEPYLKEAYFALSREFDAWWASSCSGK